MIGIWLHLCQLPVNKRHGAEGSVWSLETAHTIPEVQLKAASFGWAKGKVGPT
jgi:hypothetical protein